jgi:hypothetical protein
MFPFERGERGHVERVQARLITKSSSVENRNIEAIFDVGTGLILTLCSSKNCAKDAT